MKRHLFRLKIIALYPVLCAAIGVIAAIDAARAFRDAFVCTVDDYKVDMSRARRAIRTGERQP